MTSIHLKLCKSDQEFESKATLKFGDYLFVPLLFKKINDGLFVETSIEDIPEEIKNQINKPEKIY